MKKSLSDKSLSDMFEVTREFFEICGFAFTATGYMYDNLTIARSEDYDDA